VNAQVLRDVVLVAVLDNHCKIVCFTFFFKWNQSSNTNLVSHAVITEHMNVGEVLGSRK
jgi:hypothetical protein